MLLTQLGSWVIATETHHTALCHLQAIMRFFIVNGETQHVIWQAARSSTSTREGPESLSGVYSIGSRIPCHTQKCERCQHHKNAGRSSGRVWISDGGASEDDGR